MTQVNYRDGSPLMEITKPELRKMLNKAWDAAYWRHIGTYRERSPMTKYWTSRRYRDVSKIIKEAGKAEGEQP